MSHIPDILRQACNGVKPSDSMYFAVDEFHLEGTSIVLSFPGNRTDRRRLIAQRSFGCPDRADDDCLVDPRLL